MVETIITSGPMCDSSSRRNPIKCGLLCIFIMFIYRQSLLASKICALQCRVVSR